MARRKNNAGGGLLAGVMILLAAIALIGPFVIAGWAIFAELRARRHLGARNASEVLSDDERRQLEALRGRVAGMDSEIDATLARGHRAGYSRREDGMFDARRPAARDLNQVLERLGAVRAEAARECADAEDRIARRLEIWLRARAGVVGARAGLVAFVVVFVAMTLSQAGAVTLQALFFGVGLDPGQRVVWSGLATAAAGFAFWIGTSTARASLAA